MGSIKDTKRRQKEIMKEWKGLSAQYAKNLKSIEDLIAKAGEYFILEGENKPEQSLPGLQNDDIVLWAQHITRGQNQMNGCVTQVRNIIKEHKSIKNFTKVGKLTLKRKAPRKLIKLDTLLKHLEDYAMLIENLDQNVALNSKVIELGNKRVVEGELGEEAALKLREELVVLNSRWNNANERILRYVDRCDKFVLEIIKSYKELKLWMTKCDNMFQWLTECEKLLEQQSPVATDQQTLEEQLQDNKDFLEEGREYQPSAFDVLSSGDKLYNTNRLDKRDIRYVYKTVIALRNRWNTTEEIIENRHIEIKSRLDKLKKNHSAGQLEPWREKAEDLNKSLNSSQDHLDSIDAKLNNDDKYETLKHCTKEIQEVENRLLNQNSEALTEVSSVGTLWTSKKQLSEDDDQEVQQTVNVLHDKMSGLEQVVKLQKERLQRSTANLMTQSVTDCEQSLNDLDNTSLENFSAADADVSHVQQQIKELQLFEDKIEEQEAKHQRLVTQFNEAVAENMLDELNKNKIGARLKELDWRYKELWREHEASKRRILQALLIYSNEVITNANSWLVDAETRADKISRTSEGNKKELEKALTNQELLTHDTAANEQNIKNASLLGKTIVSNDVLSEQDIPFVEEEMELLPKRLDNLKKNNRDNHKWLNDVLNKSIPRELPPASEVCEVVEANEVETELQDMPEDYQLGPPKDEGFEEDDVHSDSTHRDSHAEVIGFDLGSKSAEFYDEAQYMNKWANESNLMVDDFYKNMHEKNAWVLQERIEERYNEIEAKQKKVDKINEMGKEITIHSTDQNTTKAINEEMFYMNNNWRECQSSLGTACEVQVQRAARPEQNGGCCLMTVIRRKITTLCSYN